MKFRKKPVVIEAVQYTGDNVAEIEAFCPDTFEDSGILFIRTLEGDHQCSVNDFVIKGVKGEFYSCKPDIFEMTYDKVEGAVATA